MKNLFLLLLSLTFILTGCRFGNSQEWSKGNCTFYGTNYLGWGDGDYSILIIGETKEMPFYKSHPEFALKFPDGESLKSNEFTFYNIQKIKGIRNYGWHCPPFLDNVKTYYGYPISSRLPAPRSCEFGFEDSSHKIVYFKGVGYGGCGGSYDDPELIEKSLMIGPITGDKFYKMPMTREQIEEIFGKPDKIRAYWEP